MRHNSEGHFQIASRKQREKRNVVEERQLTPTTTRLEKPLRIAEQVWPEGTVPVVSVFCITYNHQKFIRDTIEGFLMQETTFPVEIFIHDDASVDGTAQIIKEYAEKYPALFWIVLQTQNQWSKGNRHIFFEFLKRQKGQFIALCEGDDYWTNSKKLARQTDLLLGRKDASGCFHSANVLHGEEVTAEVNPPPHLCRDRFLEDLEFSFWLPTASLMIAKNAVPPAMNWAENLLVGDAPLIAEICAKGNLLYIPETMCVYRKHPNGVWSSLEWNEQKTAFIELFIAAEKRFKTHKLEKMKLRKKQMCLELCVWHWKRFSICKALYYWWHYAKTFPSRGVLLQPIEE